MTRPDDDQEIEAPTAAEGDVGGVDDDAGTLGDERTDDSGDDDDQMAPVPDA
jgi:hypothetical protein